MDAGGGDGSEADEGESDEGGTHFGVGESGRHSRNESGLRPERSEGERVR